ncbi:MAG TPA: AMP-binding protein [Phycisphaerae bacterium]|nr:AMP-binding protein [Phycisphaerae bacterium]
MNKSRRQPSTSRHSRAEQMPKEAQILFWPKLRWKKLQEKNFLHHVAHAAQTDFYRRRIAPRKIRSLADLELLPLTDKSDLARAGDAMLGCPTAEIREWVTTSGVTGKPLRVPLTQGDLQRLAVNEAAALYAAGLRAGDVLIIAVAMDRMFVAGLAYWLGAQRLGAACVRAGPQYAVHPELFNSLPMPQARRFVITAPSLLSAALPASGPGAYREIHTIICIAEPIRGANLLLNALARRIVQHIPVPILSTYASTETCATFAEGPLCRGGHLNPALAVVEILDSRGRPVAPGNAGEVVVTPLGVQGMPLVRFRTGDIAALYTERCPCGRTTPRLGPILGRQQQLLKVRGVSLFPAAVFDMLADLPEVRDFVLSARRAHDLSEHLTLHVHLEKDEPHIRERLKQRARALLKVLPELIFCDAAQVKSIQSQSSSRKPVRFIDLRGKN